MSEHLSALKAQYAATRMRDGIGALFVGIFMAALAGRTFAHTCTEMVAGRCAQSEWSWTRFALAAGIVGLLSIFGGYAALRKKRARRMGLDVS
jgi:hypothetical protein